MPKRPSLKGRGVDIFLGRTEESRKEKEQASEKKGKATFYFPQNILADLDEAWFLLRKIDRKIKKSDIVQASIEMALEGLKEGSNTNPLMEYFKNKK